MKTAIRLTVIACLFIIFCPNNTTAQNVEFRAQLNSGFYSYRGKSANSTTAINYGEVTNGPYGTIGAISYGASINVRKITGSNFMYGGDVGYEMLRSKVHLKFDDALGGDIVWTFRGRTYLNNGFINLFPFIGQRLHISNQPIDIILGSDIGLLLSSREKGKATATQQENIEITTSTARNHINTDVRPRIQVSTDFDKIGIYIGYAYGLMNYYKNYLGGSPEAYSRMLRLGVSYRIK